MHDSQPDLGRPAAALTVYPPREHERQLGAREVVPIKQAGNAPPFPLGSTGRSIYAHAS